LAQRLSVGSARILFVGGAVGDVAIDDNKSRSIGGVLERCKGPFEHVQIISVADSRDIPAVTNEARSYVIAVGQRGIALDADMVVVVDPTQVGELEVACQ